MQSGLPTFSMLLGFKPSTAASESTTSGDAICGKSKVN
jgi:hypothetical protein